MLSHFICFIFIALTSTAVILYNKTAIYPEGKDSSIHSYPPTINPTDYQLTNMPYTPSLTGTLTPDQADMVTELLEKMGLDGFNRKLFCEIYKVPPKGLQAFLLTTRARTAANKATSLSRAFHIHGVTETQASLFATPLFDTIAPSEEELRELGLWAHTRKRIRYHNFRLARIEYAEEARWMKEKAKECLDPTITDETIKYWNDHVRLE